MPKISYLKGLELFSKTNFESSWASEGLKICKTMYFVLPFWFGFSPSPLNEFLSCFYYLPLRALVALLFITVYKESGIQGITLYLLKLRWIDTSLLQKLLQGDLQGGQDFA